MFANVTKLFVEFEFGMTDVHKMPGIPVVIAQPYPTHEVAKRYFFCFDRYMSYCEDEMTLLFSQMAPSVVENGEVLNPQCLSRVEILHHKQNCTDIHFVEDARQLCRIS